MARAEKLIDAMIPQLTTLRRRLHEHPELRYEEEWTADVVREELIAAKVSYVAGMAGGTGIVGHLPGAAERSIALRADMDALPIHEETGLAYASKIDGKMHACGHDGHTTMLIGTARVLAELSREEQLPNPVTFLFQPAEEGGAGARRMCQDGALDGSRIGAPVEIIFGQHGHPGTPLGTTGTRVGAFLAAADEIEITIHGRGGHAAMPHQCGDPVTCAASMISALQTLVSRNTNPLDSAVLTITQLKAGDAFNVIPNEVRLGGTVRTLCEETREMFEQRIAEVAMGIAQAHGLTAEMHFERGYPVTRNDAGAVERFEKGAAAVLGPENVRPFEHPVMGGEDFSFYGEYVPACFSFLGLVPEGETELPGLHNPRFDFNDDALAMGIRVFCSLAIAGR